MSTSLKELIFAGIAFTVSYSIAIATNLDIVIDAVGFEKTRQKSINV